ncbi:AAA family ATPase [Clostridium paraputrificum]|uniref:AAA family ATPase n=1 Tax=Clostridium paraputrificum TaxID=29363 RepID=UPI00189D742B|nr:MoxR family ATPase [Clostridium paraputrificum]MDB2094329.1 MoxR family ATPase [Clostridium paraputrificum]
MNKVDEIINNMEKIMVGKRKVIERIVIALLTNGHVLIEDVPGVGKTQCVGALAKSVSGTFNRVQFTPDVMASDITGFTMYNPSIGKFIYKSGAASCNFLLGDEINRASAKTQSSLLEVMEERQVTIDGVTRKVPEPFMVLATQNPIESKGTNKLPEAQMDRFLFKLSIGYPTKSGEKEILDRFAGENPLNNLGAVVTTEDIISMQKEIEEVRVSDNIKDLIINIVTSTRNNPKITLGASPRGSLQLLKASKAVAYLQGRDYVIPEDVKEVSVDVLSHRIILSSGARVKGQNSSDIVLECVNNAIKNTSKVSNG